MSSRPTAPMIERMALAIWQTRQMNLVHRLRRMKPDDIDRASGAWGMVLEEACAALKAAKYADGADEHLAIAATNAERVEAVSFVLAWDRVIDGALEEVRG